MTVAVQTCLIGAIASVVPSIISLLNSQLARRNAANLGKITHQVSQLEVNTNSIKDALVKATGEKSYAEGLKAGQGEVMPSDQVMGKYKRGKLHSGSKHGPRVKGRKQAIAIMLSEKRAESVGKGHSRKGGRK
jgi:hypothetical protein